MKQELTANQQKQFMQVNCFTYLLYLILVAYLLVKGDMEWAIINFGIAMAFDPFDASVKWRNRPTYQKVWLYVHVGLSMTGFFYLIFR